ncbi:hypothetical protein GCM10027589_53230 [Actinocorallia lasiicapitis]
MTEPPDKPVAGTPEPAAAPAPEPAAFETPPAAVPPKRRRFSGVVRGAGGAGLLSLLAAGLLGGLVGGRVVALTGTFDDDGDHMPKRYAHFDDDERAEPGWFRPLPGYDEWPPYPRYREDPRPYFPREPRRVFPPEEPLPSFSPQPPSPVPAPTRTS